MSIEIITAPQGLLKAEINKGGFTYKQVKRGRTAVIYGRYSGGILKDYEVFLIKNKKCKMVNGLFLAAGERFPQNEAFGYWAWFRWTLDQALEKFNDLEKR